MSPYPPPDQFTTLTFDCYGTLIDWETGILNALRPVLASHDIDLADERILETYAELEAKQEVGDFIRYEVLLRLVMAEMSLRLGFDAPLQELDCISQSIKNWPPFSDTVAALRKLKTRYKLAIISNIDDALFKKSASLLSVPFDNVITAQQAGAYKPAASVFEYAIGKIGEPRERILHVAQSLYHDIAPARELGLTTVWVNRRKGMNGSGATPPASAEPNFEVSSLGELVEKMGL